LDTLVVEKQNKQRLEQEAKYQDYIASNVAKQQYDQVKNLISSKLTHHYHSILIRQEMIEMNSKSI